MTWTWGRLESTIRGLSLPHGEYALGFPAWLLVTGAADQVDKVDLLVSPAVHERLPSFGWVPVPEVAGGLQRPGEENLIAVADDTGFDMYEHPVDELIATAEVERGLPVVPVTRAKPHVVRALVLGVAGEAAVAAGTAPALTSPNTQVDPTVLGAVFTDAQHRMIKAYGGEENLPPATIPQLGGMRVGVLFALVPIAIGLVALLLYLVGGPWVPVAVVAVILAGLQIGMKTGLVPTLASRRKKEQEQQRQGLQ